MNFTQKIEQIIKLLQTTNINDLITIFKVKNIDELENLYDQDRENFMKTFFSNVMSNKNYFNPLITNDREFLEVYTPIVRDYINFRILQSNKNYDYDYLNKDKITIDEFLIISNILNYPPLPLTRYYFNEENHRDKSQIILKLFNESSYKCLESCKELFKLVIDNKISGNFKIIFDGGQYNVHNFIVNKYELFNIIRSNEITLNTNNKVIVEVIIEFLYTGSFDYKFFSKQDLIELLDDIDLEEKRNIENAVGSVKRWKKRIIEEFEENDIKLLITEDTQILIKAVEQDNPDEIFQCVECIKIKLSEFIEKLNNIKYNSVFYHFPENKLWLLGRLFEYSYKLPTNIQKYRNLLNKV